MDVRCFDDPVAFARAAAAYLDADPFSSSVIAVHVDAVVSGIRAAGTGDRYWTVVEGDKTVGIAMHTPPHYVFLARMLADAASALAQSMIETGWNLPGVNGERLAVAAFAGTWEERTGLSSTVTVSQRMYRLGELAPPVGVHGLARRAERGDLDLITGWLEAFHGEAQPHAPMRDWRTLAEERINPGLLWIWDDHETVVSMAGRSNAVAGVSRVGPVYTPPDRRRRGYGAAVTAKASAAAIDSGAAEVVLYTDISNPTSNAIYQTIGYRPHHDAEERSFHS